MERTILGGENHRAGDSDFVTKSVGSSIKIDSISIDLVSNDETDAGKCEHFSIRGFVSDVRKKNWKLCWPFALDGAHDKPDETCALPPLHVAKFRWWRCQNCLQEMGSQGNNYSCGSGSYYCRCTGSESSRAFPHLSSLGDAAVLPSDIEPDSNLNFPAGRKVDVSIAADLIVNDHCLPSHNDKSGKKSEPANTPATVGETCCEDEMNHDIPLSAGATTVMTSGLVTGRHPTVETVSLKANCNGCIEFCKPGCESNEAADMEHANENLNYMFKNSSKLFQIGKQPYSEEKNAKLMVACGSSRVVSMVDGVLDAAKGLANEKTYPEQDECDKPSSDSDQTLSANESEHHHHDNSSGSNRRKTRKVRLLTELLAENGDVKANIPRTEGFPSYSIPSSSAGLAMLSDPQGLVAAQGHTIRPSDHHRKRKSPHDEERGPLEISSFNNFHKNDRIYTESAETSGPFSSSDTKEDDRINIQSGVKSHLNKFKFDRTPSDKKINKSLGFDGFLSLAPSGGYIPEDMENRTGDSNNIGPAGSVMLESAQAAFTSRGMYSFPLPPQKFERISTVSKKKSKMPQFDERQTSLIPWSSGMLREGLARRKDVEIEQKHPIISPLQSSQDVTNRKGLQLSLNSCLNRNDGNYFSLVKHRQFPWGEGNSKENRHMGKQTNYVGNFDHRAKCESDAYLRKGANCDLSRESTRISFVKEKWKSTSYVDAGGHSLLQPQMDFFSRGNNEKSTETCTYSGLNVKHCDRQVDKVSEQAVPDDIPMEIVELMAKNQYERCLPDVGNEKSLGTTIENSKASIYAKGKSRFLSNENAYKPKPLAKNGRNGKITRSENEGTGNQKSVGCSLFQPYDPAQFMPFTYCQEKRPNEKSLETTIKNSSAPIYAKGKLRFQSDESAVEPEPRAKNGRSGKITRSVSEGTSKQNSVECSIFQPYDPAGFMPFTHCQEKSSNGIKNYETNCSKHHSSQSMPWFGNLLCHGNSQTNLQPPGSCNSCKIVPQQSKEAAHPWSSVIPSRLPLIYDIPQKHMSQSTNGDMASHCPNFSKGNLNGHHNLNFRNADVTNIENRNRSFDSESLSGPPAEYPFGCKHSRSSPLDVYSNETIPAMHLLSLMDAGLPSGAPIDSDGGNSKFLKTTSIPHDLHSKTTNDVRPSSYGYYSKSHLSENSCERFPAIQTVGVSGFQLQLDKAVKKNTGFIGQASLTSQERDKAKTSDSLSPNKDNSSQRPVLVSGRSGTGHGAIPVHNMQNVFVSSSDSMVFPLTFYERENENKHKFESRNITSTVLSPKSSFKTEVCTINRNPADFSMPEAGNIYMIRGEDLKYRKTVVSESRFKSDRRRRQKKLTGTQGNV